MGEGRRSKGNQDYGTDRCCNHWDGGGAERCERDYGGICICPGRSGVLADIPGRVTGTEDRGRVIALYYFAPAQLPGKEYV